MKSLLAAVLLLACAVATADAAQPAPPSKEAATNQLIIVCQDLARFSKTNVVWRRQVRAAEEGFYLECELLTATFTTNSARTNITGAASTTSTNGPDTRFDRVIAETNVMIISGDMQIIGDRAVYSATNDLLHVTGELVIAATAQGSIVCTDVTFDRSTGQILVGPTNTFIGSFNAFSRTNTPAAKTNKTPLIK